MNLIVHAILLQIEPACVPSPWVELWEQLLFVLEI